MSKDKEEKDLLHPVKNIKFVGRDELKANDYNPNKVVKKNMELLVQSILTNGFCFPIVVRKDYTIIDGFHRWLVSGEEPLRSRLGGKVPIVIVDHKDSATDIYGTITFNRARGTHLLEPMENIVKALIEKGKTIEEIEKQTGMSKEEVFRLSDIDRQSFLKLMIKSNKFSNAEVFNGLNKI